MKTVRVVLVVVLVVFVAIAWLGSFKQSASANSEYNSYIREAVAYTEDGLYQKAVKSYESALALKETLQVRSDMIEVLRLSYEEGTSSSKAYKSALEKATDLYPKQTAFWEQRLQLLCDSTQYVEAHSVLNKAIKRGARSELLDKLKDEILYSYTMVARPYAEVYQGSNGIASVTDGRLWGVLGADGEQIYDLDYSYVSPVNSQNDIVLCTSGSVRLYDTNGVVQKNLESENFFGYVEEEVIYVEEEEAEESDIGSGSVAESDGEDDHGEENVVEKDEEDSVGATSDEELSETEAEAEDEEENDNAEEIKTGAAEDAVTETDTETAEETDLAAEEYDFRQKQYYTMRAYGDGMIPMLVEGSWQYYSCDEQALLPERFDEASAYTDGQAAVCTDGTWHIIDIDGKRINDTDFSDIVLYGNGEYCSDDIMIAARDGVYGIYTAEGQYIAGSAEDMDLYMGGLIAYSDGSGKWGYIDAQGNVVIEPQFDEAKSFSGGFGAVYSSDADAWGFIIDSGKLVIDYRFLSTGYFTTEGVCFVSLVSGTNQVIKLRFP